MLHRRRSAAISPPAPLLDAGVWPITGEQRRCIVASAAASEAWDRYTAAGVLIGAAIMNVESNVTEALLATPQIEAVLALPLANITAGLEDWVAEVMDDCSIPPWQLQGVNASDAQSVRGKRAASRPPTELAHMRPPGE